MASSNRHWPSLFKSKPCTTHQQWQQELNPYHQKSPYSSVSGCDERSPEPKPRWNPKPEQIRILEAIFNSGMVNPPRDEIRKIRAQLQEYGQVGDANVFYWFQNRKSRSKHKQRQLQSSRLQSRSMAAAAIPSPPAALTAPSFSASASAAATSSSSSSSEQSSGSEKNPQTVVSVGGGLTSVVHTPTLPVTSMMNSVYFHSPLEFGCESFLLQSSQGYCISTTDLTDIVSLPEPGNGLWSDLMGQSQGCKGVEDESKIKGPWLCGFGAPTSAVATAAVSTGSSSATTATFTNVCASNTSASTTILCASTSTVSCHISEMQGFGLGAGTGVSGGHSGGGGALPAPVRSTVFINEVAFEVPNGPLNVREVFGDEAVLINSSGHPVITDEWGSTIQPLQHGASYYLILAN